jgi:filamentous hemagglutinin family protein
MFLSFPGKVLQCLAGFLGICSVIFYFKNSALAQIIPDESLGGAEQSELRRDVDVRGLPGDIIEGGAVRGNNLFHSFSEFNVNDGQRVYFANPGGIENIISRVTGNNPSNIFGTLGIDGAGSLFFINPNGIVFGENANLDIAGSFVASTAKSLVFENGFEFTTENPAQPPLLTINLPIGLQLGVNSGGILLLTGSDINTTGFRSDQSIGLVANAVVSQGGFIQAGQIEIGSVGDESVIGITQQDSGFKFKYDEVNNFADILLEDKSEFQAIGRGGDITINGRDISFSGNSNITSFLGNNLTVNGRNISFSGNSNILLFGGNNLTINGRNINILNGSDIYSWESGDLIINGDRINIIGNSYLYSRDSKDLKITTDILSVNGGIILKENGQGDLTIEANDLLEVVGVPFQPFSGSIIFSKDNLGADISLNAAIGGGNLTISTKNLIIRDGGQIYSLAEDFTSASNILINATESIEVTGRVQLDNDRFLPSRILAASGSTTLFPNNPPSENDVVLTGAGGNLSINTGKLTVSNEGEITVRSTTLGDAGTLTVNADSILLDEGKITATSDNAKGGNINLTASDLLLMRDHSLISAQSFGTDSQDGNIKIGSQFVIALPSEDSDIIARSTNRGDIKITADSVIGYQYGELTPLSSDITASGTVTLNVPNVDPTQGLTQFPTELVDPSQQIDQSCAVREEDESKFTVIGRTGLPQSPNEVLTPDMVLDDLGTLATREGDAGMRVDEDAKNAPTTPSTSNSQSPLPLIPREDSEFPNRPKQLVEAQGWVVDAQGKVTLVAQAPTVIPHPLAVTSASCHTPQLPHR